MKTKNVKSMLYVCLIYLGFFAVIGLAIYVSERLLPLWALLLCPSMEVKEPKR